MFVIKSEVGLLVGRSTSGPLDFVQPL